jgi:hypothetical protein
MRTMNGRNGCGGHDRAAAGAAQLRGVPKDNRADAAVDLSCYHRPMSTHPKPKLTDAERHARFKDMAREVEASEDPKEFDKAFDKVTGEPPKGVGGKPT